MKIEFPLLLALMSTPALAEESRAMDSHEHGVGALDIAVHGNTVAMELYAPGADIVGFEYAAESSEDRAAIDAAVATLARPLDLFVLPDAARCSVVQASATLESEEKSEDHHEEHHDDHQTHDHGEDHADRSDDHDHGDHDKDHASDHADEPNHSEFHAEYSLNCGNPGALSPIEFAYFETFANARELQVRIVTLSGAKAFDVERGNPVLDLRGMF